MVGFWIGRIHDPEVRVLSRPAGGHVRDLISARGKRSHEVAGLAVRQQGYVSGPHVIAIELKPLASSNILRENDVISAVRMKSPGRHAVREKRELRPRSAGTPHQMKLRRIAEARGNQHFPLLGMPVREA